MLKNLSGKVRALLIAGIAAVVVLAAVLTGSLALRVDAAQAQEKALAAAGGGEVVGQEIDQEGPWNEYSFDIVNGDVWYEVEVNAFGRVNGLESGQAGYGDYSHWEGSSLRRKRRCRKPAFFLDHRDRAIRSSPNPSPSTPAHRLGQVLTAWSSRGWA